MKEEMLDIYDDAGQRIGVKPYAEVHRDGNWHRVVGLFVINSRKEILMQRRSRKKSISPGLLTVSVGGHLRTGEDEYYCMKREMREEMGMWGLHNCSMPARTLKYHETKRTMYFWRDTHYMAI